MAKVYGRFTPPPYPEVLGGTIYPQPAQVPQHPQAMMQRQKTLHRFSESNGMVRELLLAAMMAISPVFSVAPVNGLAAGPQHGSPLDTAWSWPLEPQPSVIETFHAPPTPWAAGHRGVDLAAAVRQPVLSVGSGQVSFIGRIAGRGVMVVAHAHGLRTTYEPVSPTTIEVGQVVSPGDRLGFLESTPGHCSPGYCLHWGLLRHQTYLDPLTLLNSGPPVLLPLYRSTL